MSEPLSALAPEPSGARPRAGRAVIFFAVAGVVVALVAAGLYLLRPAAPDPARSTPESAVREFLGAVFLAHDPTRVSKIVCAGWDPNEAITRTTGGVDSTARVSWDQVAVISTDQTRANVRARLGFRFPDDKQPSAFSPWRFSVVDESGWRVCEARPFVS